MKKLLAFIILGTFLFSSHAHAAAAAIVPPPVVVGVSSGLPDFWLFSGALAGAAMVEYFDAEGIAFPVCGDNWMSAPQKGTKCFGEYPAPVHKDGV